MLKAPVKKIATLATALVVATTLTTTAAGSAQAAAGPCWSYTFVDWGISTAGSQCPSGTFGWSHRVVATFAKDGQLNKTLRGPWKGGTSKSYVSAGLGWQVISHHVEQSGDN
ncbi:hypothetical protein SAMN05421874_109139 [Nonomuraea maritima]|uniref:Secreted protein n=1 Tax=Nonomuraea maritima TaxID=683260 RepID=A0A1G9DH17_9ACTN|nr:hypothetical protein [Nonomuraea maritima]SDK63173.1 hypothetical protein SAMN05421874_109139 [Nonomuraea maritima]